MRIYNIVCDTQKEKYDLLTLFKNNNIKVCNVAGYYDGYIIHVEIATLEAVNFINHKIDNYFASNIEL